MLTPVPWAFKGRLPGGCGGQNTSGALGVLPPSRSFAHAVHHAVHAPGVAEEESDSETREAQGEAAWMH